MNRRKVVEEKLPCGTFTFGHVTFTDPVFAGMVALNPVAITLVKFPPNQLILPFPFAEDTSPWVWFV